jgi:TolB-like protein
MKGTALDVAEIGRQLHVGSVLEGSVRKDGERLPRATSPDG